MISTTNESLLKTASAAIAQVIDALGCDANKMLNMAHDLLRQCIEQRVLGYPVLFGRLMVAKSQIERALVALKEEADKPDVCDGSNGERFVQVLG